MTLGERFGSLWSHIRQTARSSPARVTIRPDHVFRAQPAHEAAGNGSHPAPETFAANQHYFQVRVNELFLVNQRDWFTEYDPIVVTSTEFLYANSMEVLPFAVGPSMIGDGGKAVPTGMLFTNTSVAGPHPYRGGPLKLSVILGQVKREDYARKYLGWIENATKIFDFATALGSYLKIATLVLDGVETLLGTGSDKMLIGLRTEIDPDAGDTFNAGYYALVDAPDVRAEELWVIDHQLHYGPSAARAKPFRDANYVLYSITRATDRTDEAQLPFYELYERSIALAAQSASDVQWKLAKASLATLSLALRQSPDLTVPQASRLRERYIEEMQEERRKAVDISELSEAITLGLETREALQLLEI